MLLVAPQVVPEDEEPPLRLLGGVVLPPVLDTEPGELCPRVLVTVVQFLSIFGHKFGIAKILKTV